MVEVMFLLSEVDIEPISGPGPNGDSVDRLNRLNGNIDTSSRRRHVNAKLEFGSLTGNIGGPGDVDGFSSSG